MGRGESVHRTLSDGLRDLLECGARFRFFPFVKQLLSARKPTVDFFPLFFALLQRLKSLH